MAGDLRGVRATALAVAVLLGAACDEHRTVTPKTDGGFEDVPNVVVAVPEAGPTDAAAAGDARVAEAGAGEGGPADAAPP